MRKKLGLFSIFIVSPVVAEGVTKEYGIVGLSTTYGQSVYSTESSASIGITPNLFYNGDLGFIDGSLFNYNAFRYLGLSANWRFSEVNDSVNDIVNGIDNRDGNPELGFTIGTPGARITYLHDVANEHNGQEVQVHLGRVFETPLDKFSISPYLEVLWQDKKLSQHLYGVSAAESIASGLQRFDADDTWVYKTGLIGLYEVMDNWVVISKVKLEHHDSNSGLLQRDLGWSTEIGIVYQFAGN
ncbi:MipA/OmpV family protein [Psychromonas sp. RZ22]|uniref:MipA/OmpV family protein n=1 Tax=Psychromonas algarum TaxID=2555643 RepID=UPI001067D83A|nr:MipA/OmpV family protein [Psychromonas sp. RZ22]TEW54943.1 MipA/OmpV family protein [Psychromonas sp. RZ22]